MPSCKAPFWPEDGSAAPRIWPRRLLVAFVCTGVRFPEPSMCLLSFPSLLALQLRNLRAIYDRLRCNLQLEFLSTGLSELGAVLLPICSGEEPWGFQRLKRSWSRAMPRSRESGRTRQNPRSCGAGIQRWEGFTLRRAEQSWNGVGLV